MDRPRLFGKYCLLERVSVGGMAEVFRAKPMPVPEGAGNKQLALKRILPHLAEDDEFITMFVDEAKLTVNLKHPNIVETYELGDFKDSYYILMEFISGADVLALQKRLRRQRKIMSVAQACYIALKVARGLDYAHQATDEQGRPFNLIHRDVSPQNIRLTFDGRVKLIDFGIAKAASQRTKTQVGVLKGKFGYMSPEQVRQKNQEKDIDHRCDLFALGTCLWEMLTNRRLFQGDDEYETFQMLKNPGDRPAPSDKNSQVPPEVDRIVGKALAEDRQKRYQTGGEMAEDLESYLNSLDQPYTREHLSAWMAETFGEELEEERRKRSLYREIRRPADVRAFIDEYCEEEEQQAEAEAEPVSGEQQVEADEQQEDADLWEPDFAPGKDDVDRDEFVSNHTRVAAGGFNPEEFEDDSEDPTADIIENPEEHEAVEEFEAATLDSDEEGDMEAEETPAPAADSQPAPPSPATAGQGEGNEGGPPSARPQRQQDDGPPKRRAKSRSAQQVQQTASGTQVGQRTQQAEEGGKSATEIIQIATAVVAVVGVIALGVVTGLMAYQKSGAIFGGGNQPSTLVVSTSPLPDGGASVIVDGKKRGTDLPLAVSDLKPGSHTIEVKHPGFQSATKTVKLRGGDWTQVSLTLERNPSAKGVVRLRWTDKLKTADVYLDGERVEPSTRDEKPSDGEIARDIRTNPGRHLVEVLVDGHRPWSRIVEVPPGATIVEPVEPREVGLSLGIDSDSDATVSIDGVGRGSVPVKVDALSPLEVHQLEVTWTDETWSTALAFPRLGRETLKLSPGGTPASLEKEEVAYLKVSTGKDWWPIFIDGAPTGLTTPVTGDRKIPVAPGERRITFRRGRSSHQISVDLSEGEVRPLNKNISFEWSP